MCDSYRSKQTELVAMRTTGQGEIKEKGLKTMFLPLWYVEELPPNCDKRNDEEQCLSIPVILVNDCLHLSSSQHLYCDAGEKKQKNRTLHTACLFSGICVTPAPSNNMLVVICCQFQMCCQCL